jgi:hypothetical protein
MNKKGFVFLTEEQMSLVVYVFVILIIFGVLSMGSYIFVNKSIESPDLERHLLINGLLYSSTCLNYADDYRSYPGIVDLDNFNENRLSNCISYKVGGQGFKLTLFDSNESFLDEVEVNPSLFAQGLLCGLKESKFECFSKRFYVLYEDNSFFERGYLDVKVVTPK